jgi:AraC-like DNA-binding protein
LLPTDRYFYFIELSSAVVFLHGPVIWFYYHALTSKKPVFKIKYLLHLLPFAINLLIILPALYHQRLAPFSETERNLLLAAKLISIIVYTGITIMQLQKHKKLITDYFSNTDKKELQWLQLVLYGFLIIWIIAILSQVLVLLGNQFLVKEDEDLLVNIAVSLLVIIIGYYGFRQGSVFQNIPIQVILNEPGTEDKKGILPEKSTVIKYKKSGLDKTKVLQLADSLLNYMKLKRPYLEPELTLMQLAKGVNISANDLSQVINESFSVNFFDFINAYRVTTFKNAITSGEMNSKTLLGIALESGFNSKASFNRAFKKMTGQTPSEYIAGLKLS